MQALYAYATLACLLDPAEETQDKIDLCELDVMIRRLPFSWPSDKYKFEDAALIVQIVSSEKEYFSLQCHCSDTPEPVSPASFQARPRPMSLPCSPFNLILSLDAFALRWSLPISSLG